MAFGVQRPVLFRQGSHQPVGPQLLELRQLELSGKLVPRITGHYLSLLAMTGGGYTDIQRVLCEVGLDCTATAA